MNYLIVTSSHESSECAKILIQEICRFDIRAEIYRNASNEIKEIIDLESEFEIRYKTIKSKFLKARKYDLMIIIGESFDHNLVKKIGEQGGKMCFFLQTTNYKVARQSYQQAIESFDRVLVDLPIYELGPKSENIGHYLNDIIRKYEFPDPGEELRIGIVLSERRNINKFTQLVQQFSKSNVKCEWILCSQISEQINRHKYDSLNIKLNDNKLDTLKNSNVVIVDSEIDSIAAVLMNCPQLSISGKHSFLGFIKTKIPLINKIGRQNIIKNIKPGEFDLLQKELNLLLNDHEYCASMLSAYQSVKDKIGTQPVVRTAAQELVNWVGEEKS